MSRFTYEYAGFMHFSNREIKYVAKCFVRYMFTFAEIFIYLCAMRHSTENRWFERIPLIKSVLQDKPDPLLMNSTHSRCSTFRNSTRCNRQRKAGLSHDADTWTWRHVIPVANFTLIKLSLRSSNNDDV